MSYSSWLAKHKKKRQKIVSKLSHLSIDEIIDYFDYDNMVAKEKDFCPLYKNQIKCHNLSKLNCYLCACPYFRFTDKKSYCIIDSKYAKKLVDKNGYEHLDCSDCTFNHTITSSTNKLNF
jgi:Zn-finger protein